MHSPRFAAVVFVTAGAFLLGGWYLYHSIPLLPRSARGSQHISSDVEIDDLKQNKSSILLVANSETLASAKTAKSIDDNSEEAASSLNINLVIVPYFRYNATKTAVLEREKEYMTVLQRNLDHHLVSLIHVLTTNTEETLHHLDKFILPNSKKLLISEVKCIDHMRDVFDYISENLVGKDVMFLNADIYLGGGFDSIDPLVMRQQKIMYALTRRVTEEERCGVRDMCIESKYVGSHDAFLFHLAKAVPENALEFLNYTIPSSGMENVLIWVFQMLGYHTLNPCSLVEVFHLHCTGLRNYHHRPKVNSFYNTGLSPFTEKLVRF